MIRTFILMIALTAPAASIAQKIGEVERTAPTTSSPRGVTLEWTSNAGQPYWYRLPEKLSARKPPNLIVLLHGSGMNHGWGFWNYGVGRGEFRGDDIVVSPEGMTPGGNGTFNFGLGKKDGEQIAELIGTFRKEFSIDRVYLYGHSQGAFFAYWFAGAHTPLVDGIVAHAGNVLDVDHNALARKKLAVCILHGRADAVVSVECAYRTERIYREAGYEKLRLEVVEGLDERTGHWPLPAKVKEMLAWLDTVTVATARGAADAALAEIAEETPDLGTIVASLERARRLEGKAPRESREALTKDLAAVAEFVERAVDAHIAALAEIADDTEDGAWLGHFRRAHAALERHPRWKKEMVKLSRLASKDEKAAAKITRRLAAKWNAKSFKACEKFLRENRLAPTWDVLAGTVESRLSLEVKGIDGERSAALGDLIGRRRAFIVEGIELARKTTAKAKSPR